MRSMRAVVLIVAVLWVPISVRGAVVKGRVRVVDENGKAYKTGYVPGEMNVSLLKSGTRSRCGSSAVSNVSLEIAPCVVDESCAIGGLDAEFDMLPDVGWEQHPIPTAVRVCEKGVCDYEITLQVPRNLSRNARKKIYDRGVERLAHSVDEAVFYFREAARGDDLEYTVAAANLLEKERKQGNVWEILKDKDFTHLSGVTRHTRFQLMMRQANAARAARDYTASLRHYSLALGIYPRNTQAPSLALTTIKQAANAERTEEVVEALEQSPELREGFVSVYEAWELPGKPAIEPNDANFAPPVAFAYEHVREIPTTYRPPLSQR